MSPHSTTFADFLPLFMINNKKLSVENARSDKDFKRACLHLKEK